MKASVAICQVMGEFKTEVLVPVVEEGRAGSGGGDGGGGGAAASAAPVDVPATLVEEAKEDLPATPVKEAKEGAKEDKDEGKKD